jgi:acetolactate synthase-1/2/3 large subunit
MVEVSGTTLVGRSLNNEGVKTIFTLCGGPSLISIYNTCVDEGIELIDMRHEQAVANAATGYAMATRGPGVALVTSGPGVVNMASGMAAAWYAGAPVIGICAHSPHYFEGKGAVQEFNSGDMFRSITKWRGYCTATHRIPEYIATAFRHANVGRKGPVLLDFPDDTLLLKVREERAAIVPPDKYRTTARHYGEPALAKKAVKLLLDAERPAILIGSGVLWSGASEELIQFAELLKIPVCYAIGGKGGIPDDHPLCGGIVAYEFGSIAEADVLLAIGVRFEEILGYGTGALYAPDVKVISVDIEPLEIGRNRPIDIGISGDARAVLTQLIEAANEALRSSGRKREETEWVRKVRNTAESIWDALRSAASSPNKPIHPGRLGKEICEFLGKDAYLVSDGGEIQSHVVPQFCASFPGSFVSALGGLLGHLGGGIPFGIGVKTAKPDAEVLVIEGDGSFLFNASEIDTAVRHNKQIVVVVGNDCQWGAVRHCQELANYYDVCGKLNENVRYDKYAESLGAYGELVTDPGEIRPALGRAFDSGLPAVLDVRIDHSILTFINYYLTEQERRFNELYKELYVV